MVDKITKWLYLEPLLFKEGVHLAEISKKIGRNHSVVRQYLNYFEKQGIVRKQIVGRMTMYRLNMKYPLIVDIIFLIEKEKLVRKSEDMLVKEIVWFIHDNFSNDVLVFGSFVDNSKKAGDIDLLVIGSLDKNKFKEIEKRLNKKIHLINVEKIEDVSSVLKEEIKSKHLIVQGAEELIKWLI